MNGVYICRVCGTQLSSPEVENHFRVEHPEHIKRLTVIPRQLDSMQRLLLKQGLLEPANRRQRRRDIHTCTLCGKRFSIYTAATMHFMLEHPDSARPLFPQNTPLYEAWRILLRAGYLKRDTPHRPSQRRRKRRNAMDILAEEMESLVETTVSDILSLHLGMMARVSPSQVARRILKLNGGRNGVEIVLCGATAKIFEKWYREGKVLTDTFGRQWKSCDVGRSVERNRKRTSLNWLYFSRINGQPGDTYE